MFSGAVKAVDPLGSAYKFSDYFQAFHLEFLQPFALVLAIILFTAEFISGFSVLSGYRQKTGIWGVMILMAIFTPLTLVPGNLKSCFRLGVWRCDKASYELADIREEYCPYNFYNNSFYREKTGKTGLYSCKGVGGNIHRYRTFHYFFHVEPEIFTAV
jgi:hypothetical protein